MVTKRKLGGFQVGPENLPDGPRKRKAEKIKSNLILKAKIKQDFRKVQERKARERNGEEVEKPTVYEGIEEEEEKELEKPPAGLELHPDRQALVDAPAQEEAEPPQQNRRRERQPRRDPYDKEVSKARQQREEAETRQREREEAHQQWQEKTRERERMQRAMRKARVPGKDGKRRLGRESEVLLEKVKKLVGKG